MNKKIIKLLVYLIVISFLCSYLIDKTGYYEYSLNNKKNLTEESIKRFEEDVKKSLEAGMNGHLSKPIDIKKMYALLDEVLRKFL